jgi:hypothetical protein
MAIYPLFHLRSDSTARPFDTSFSLDPTSCHYCPCTTIGADISITGPPPTPKTYQPEDILNTITANAENNLQRCERGKLGRMHKLSTHTTHFIHGDETLVNYTKKTWSSSHSQSTPGHDLVPCYKHSSPPPTIHVRNPGKPHTPTINIIDQMPISCMNAPPNHNAHLGFSLQLTSDGANLPRPLAKHSLVTPTPHPHQVYIHSNSLLIGLSISKAYSSLLCNATRTFQLHPAAPTFDIYSFLTLEDTCPVRRSFLNYIYKNIYKDR